MTTLWESLAGDTDAFALKLAFASDPDEGQGIDPETSLSWGSFQVWVCGRNLCAHREEGESIEAVHWYLLPLLEWFTDNWDPLFHEERLPGENAGDNAWDSLRATSFPPPAVEDNAREASRWESAWQAWRSRHALQTAKEGGLFPDIVLRRLRDRIELSWGSVRSAGMPDHYRFTESERGCVSLPPCAVAEPLHDVLSQAGRYLSSLMPESRRVEGLNRKLRRLRAAGKAQDKARERRLAWLAGLGTTRHGVRAGWRQAEACLSDLPAPSRQAMLEVAETPLVVTGSCHAALMFGSLAPNVKASDVQVLARATADLYAPEGETVAGDEMCHAAPVEESASRPWSQGYELAEKVHEHFQIIPERNDGVDVEGMIGELDIRIEKLELSDTKVRGVAIAGPQHRPGIFVNERHASNAHEAGRRFTLAHEFCHLLFDRERGRPLAIASGPWAPRAVERRANAFAAMLLMPTSLVKRAVAALPVPTATREAVDEVAKHLRVGRLAVLNHLENLGFVDESDRQRLAGQLSFPVPR